MIRNKYNKKNDDRYLPFMEEHRIRSKSKWNKIDKAKIDRWGKDSQLRYDYLMQQQKAKADVTRIMRQLALYGDNGDLYSSGDEMREQLRRANELAWPKDKSEYNKMKEQYTVKSR